MVNIELYINGKLCDTGKNFGVRLRRQLINPSELNTKDAQKSYDITLPPTHTNDTVFSYSSVEETKGKFNRDYSAELIINSRKIFKGKFRLSEINNDGYRGNLVVPVSKTVKDIFGSTLLTENVPLFVDFAGFSESVNSWNAGGYDKNKYGDIPPCIFPYVLYGLLPRLLSNNEDPSKDLWDNSVIISREDLPPSLNVLYMLQHIFRSKGYTLQGSALEDVRLSSLYMSYRNDTDYVQPWNYGTLGKMSISGEWQNYRPNGEFERNVSENPSSGAAWRSRYTSDLLRTYNGNITINSDAGGNILYSGAVRNGRLDKTYSIIIPVSGYYKVNLQAELKLDAYNQGEVSFQDPLSGIYYTAADADGNTEYNTFKQTPYELKVVRDRGSLDFGLGSIGIDGTYYRDNLNQDPVTDESNYEERYMPNRTVTSDGKPSEIMFVDPKQNDKIITGLAWGQNNRDYHLMDVPNADTFGRVLAAKTGLSWDNEATPADPTRLVISSPGYYKRVVKPDGVTWFKTDKFKIEVANAPLPYARRGYFDGQPGDNKWCGDGDVSVIVWLDKGEQITVVDSSEQGYQGADKRGWVTHSVKFTLNIEPFVSDKNWAKVNYWGDGTEVMNWNDPTDFLSDKIDLVKFLPNEVRTDEFIDNFCKAFNLKLSQTGPASFSLDVKQSKKTQQYNYINLDTLASVRYKTNQPLNLPSEYSIGFTVNEEERGYVVSDDSGGGSLHTGAIEEKITEQKSTFSYNWFENIRKVENETDTVELPLPVISNAEVWTPEAFYRDVQNKRYTDLAQRFWYFDGLLNDLGASFVFGGNQRGESLKLAKVSNTLPGLNTLSYKNKNGTILTNYFSLLTDADSHYTLIECYLQPEQYEEIGNGAKVRFNGDVYYIADIDGYDPLNKNKCTLKLIRQI